MILQAWTDAQKAPPSLGGVSGQILPINGSDYEVFISNKVEEPGNFGVVYFARAPSGNIVAVKEIQPVARDSVSASASVETENIAREINLLRQSSHPNIVTMLDGEIISGYGYIAMELLKYDLQFCLLNAESLSSALYCQVALDIGNALVFLHALFIKYGDIKLENVMVDQKGVCKLVDFGAAVQLKSAEETVANIYGATWEYVAPEGVQLPIKMGLASDMWALGMLIYVLASGRFLVYGRTTPEIIQKILRPLNYGDFPSQHPLAFSLVKTLLVRDPTQRLSAPQFTKHTNEVLEMAALQEATPAPKRRRG
jgi:serine/threonine protein kinase